MLYYDAVFRCDFLLYISLAVSVIGLMAVLSAY